MSPKSVDLSTLLHKIKQDYYKAQIKLDGALNDLTVFADLTKKNQLAHQAKESGDSEPVDYQAIQLLLQYRLNSQDILRALFQSQQNLYQLLGLSPAHSTEVNLERLAYALGNDDLNLLLSMVNRLAEALLKLIAQIENKNKVQQRLKRRRGRSLQKQWILVESPGIKQLQKGIEKQKELLELFVDINLNFEEIGGAPSFTAVLDEIDALQGPISRFYEALQAGLVLSGSLYQQFNINPSLTTELSQTLEQVHQALHLTTSVLEPQRFFSHDNQPNDTPLEDEAARRRLGNFFHH
jgi:hypothetical protein